MAGTTSARGDTCPSNLDSPAGPERAASVLDGIRWTLYESRIRVIHAATPVAHERWRDAEMQYLEDRGLAHDHVLLKGTGCLVRVPKQSQIGLPAQENLDHEAACFMRAAASGATPALFGVMEVSPRLPHGALLVEYIPGRAARPAADMGLIVRCLAALHALPIPGDKDRAPLRYEPDPLVGLRVEIAAQAQWLDKAGLHTSTERAIRKELQRLDEVCRTSVRPPSSLIAFDAHPGNFVVRDDRAVLVDLEKCRYSFASLDLAHATLYTSTTWDANASAVLSAQQVLSAYAGWEQALVERMPTSAEAGRLAAMRPWHLPLRRAMWLWSVTWCAKWRMLSALPPRSDAEGEDWSARHSEPELVAHVRERVNHYLHPLVVAQVLDEFEALRCEMGTSGA